MYKNFGLIGSPIKHTLSPYIHSHFMRKLSIVGGFCSYDVSHGEIKELLDIFKRYHFKGFSITLPYKHEIVRFCNNLHSSVLDIGTCNSVKIDELGTLTGYNTDGLGFSSLLNHSKIQLEGKNILYLGAGGASLPVWNAIKNLNYNSMIIANRTEAKAEKLRNKYNIDADIINLDRLSSIKKDIDIVINGTSIGVSDNIFDIDLSSINPKIAIDIFYSSSGKTPFLNSINSEFKIDGLLMLIYQAYESFLIWNDIQSFNFNIEQLQDEIREMGSKQ